MSKKLNNINLSENSTNSENLNPQSNERKNFNNNPSNIFQNKTEEKVIEVNHLIESIKRLSPISIWKLAEATNMSHSKLYYILRDLEFAGVIFSKIRLNENNRSERVIYIGREAQTNE